MSKTLLSAGVNLGDYVTVGGFNDAIEIYHLMEADGVAPLFDGGTDPTEAIDSSQVVGITQIVPGQWSAYFRPEQESAPPPRQLPTKNAVVWCETSNGNGAFVNAMDLINAYAVGGVEAQELVDSLGPVSPTSTAPATGFGG